MNEDDNSGFSSVDLGLGTNNTNTNTNSNNMPSNDNIPGINGGFTSSDLNNNVNTNTLNYDFSNNQNNVASSSNSGVFLNNGSDVNNTGSPLINVITDDATNNSIFNKPKEEHDFFNVPPDLEGGFNSTPPPDETNGDFIVPPNFSNSVYGQPVQNSAPSKPVTPPPQQSVPPVNLINAYQEDDDEDDGIFGGLFSKKKNNKNSVPSLNIKNRILRDKNIFKDIEVFKSFFKVVVDVIVFVVVAILLYRLYVKESSNVVKKLSRDANQYYKVCTVEKSYSPTINMSGAFGIYQYDGVVYLEEVVLWSASKGMIKIQDGQTEGDVVSSFAGLADVAIEVGKGEVLAVNNYYKKPGMVYTSQTESFTASQYADPNALVKKFIDYGANCR